MDGLRDLAGRLDVTGGSLADLARRLRYAGPDEAAFGADGPGRLGEIGGILHRQWSAALDNRARELLATAERLADTGTALRIAEATYADSDAAAHHRRPEEA